jgi:hypothetical protein
MGSASITGLQKSAAGLQVPRSRRRTNASSDSNPTYGDIKDLSNICIRGCDTLLQQEVSTHSLHLEEKSSCGLPENQRAYDERRWRYASKDEADTVLSG